MKDYTYWREFWQTGKAMEWDQWIRAIQSDAARSERERAARVCERMCQQASDIGCASRYQHVREGQAMLATAFREVADYLRDMPDAKSTDGDAGEGA